MIWDILILLVALFAAILSTYNIIQQRKRER